MNLNSRSETAVFALGGLGEVGKNMYCVEHEDSLIIIDAGIRFPEDDLPGIDYVIPDYSYLVRNQYKIKALLITHGHEDHIGGIPFLLQRVHIPLIYAPRLAIALIQNKLEEHRIREKVKMFEINGDTHLDIGPFQINFFTTTHSIPDSLGLSIDTPNGRVVHTGDFKIDLTPVGQNIDLQKIARIGSEGVTLLLSDSTNAEVEGYSLTEQRVVKSIHDVVHNTPGRLIVATFASNIHRIQQIVEAGVSNKRKIVIFGRSMDRTVNIGRKYGYIKAPDSSFITPETLKNYRPEEILILCTGSQGEPMAALSRIAADTHKHLKIFPGDTVVFSSSPIPGNTQSVNRVVNALTRRGANVLTNSILTNLHASGHASREELKYMLSLFAPKYFMPIHGEYRMLKLHSEIAHALGIPKSNTFVFSNGDVVLLSQGSAHTGRRVETDDIYVDGKDTSGLSTAVIRDRKILSTDGVVTVLVSLDSRNNKLLTKPFILSRGFMFLTESGDMMKQAAANVEAAIMELYKGKVTFSDLKNTIRNTVSTFLYDRTNRNPMIIPVIMNRRETEEELATKEPIAPRQHQRRRSGPSVEA